MAVATCSAYSCPREGAASFQTNRSAFLTLFFFAVSLFWAWQFLTVEYCRFPTRLTHGDTWFHRQKPCTSGVGPGECWAAPGGAGRGGAGRGGPGGGVGWGGAGRAGQDVVESGRGGAGRTWEGMGQARVERVGQVGLGKQGGMGLGEEQAGGPAQAWEGGCDFVVDRKAACASDSHSLTPCFCFR